MKETFLKKRNEKDLVKTESNVKDFAKKHYLSIRLVSTLIISCLLGILSNVVLIAFQTKFDWERVYLQVFEIRPELFWVGSLILAMVYLWITAVIGNRTIGIVIFAALSFVTGIVTYEKMLARSEPLYPSDLSMITGLPSLLKMVDVKVVLLTIIMLIIVISLIVFIWKFSKKKEMKSRNVIVIRIVGFLCTTILLVYVSNFNQPGNKVKDFYDQYAVWTTHSQQTNYLHNGFLSGFLYNLDGPIVAKPNNYSKEVIEEINQKYQKKADEINSTRKSELEDVNIIYIMNETFSNPMKLDGISVSENPIPLTNERMNNTISGEVLSQGYGGGTANIEFEALTGISLEPMESNITTPYIQMTSKMKKLPSIVNYLINNNYSATAIHPFNTSMYKRSDVYEQFGFKTFLDEDSMKYTDKKETNRYISDESAYKEVLKQLAQTKEKDFIHLVTMQNHATYTGKYSSLNFSVEGVKEKKEAENYYQDLSYSDQALETFLNQVEQMEEKTLVVFWGDHLPSFYGNEIYDQNGSLVMHQTPMLIYSNFKDTNTDIGTTSPIYFMNYILEETESFVTPYYALLEELEEVLPAFEKGNYIENSDGKDTVKVNRDDLSDKTWKILKDYEMILYDLTTGSNYTSDMNFYN